MGELPPLRDTQYHIDFVLTEHTKLRLHVLDLLKKDFVGESTSRYAVPALLTLKEDGSCGLFVDKRALN